MTIRYPESWIDLTTPQTRLELLEYLKEAADPMGYRDRGIMESLVHFVFDDHDFSPDPLAELGRSLRTREEARALAPFVAALDAAIGPRRRSLRVVNAEDWKPVTLTAGAAYAILAESGLPTIE